MKKFTIIVFIFTFYIVHCTFAQPVIAADATPSSDVKTKLEELKREIASKAAKLKQEVNRKLTNKAYVGKLKSKSLSSLTLSTRSGPKIVSLNQDTLLPKKSIAEEDYIASLGDVDETGVLIAKKVIALPQPTDKPKAYLWGQVVSISDRLITLKDKDLKNVAVSQPSSSNVKLNDVVILTGSIGKNDIFKTVFVYVIPQGGIIKPATKSATPSGKNK